MKTMIDNIIENCRSLSIVGMAKNSGKTVTINWIMDKLYERNIKFSITSIGKDGESRDIVTDTEKPKVHLREGTVVATGKTYFDRIYSGEVIAITDIITPVGNIVVGKVTQNQDVLIAGPSSNGGLRRLMEIYKSIGVKLSLIDGALDRVSLASPSVSEAVVLATGAAIGRSIDEVIVKTIHKIRLLETEEIESQYKDIVKDQIDSGYVSVIDKDLQVYQMGIGTSLKNEDEILKSLDENSRILIVPGSLMGGLVNKIVSSFKYYRDIIIVVSDGTKIFINNKDYIQYKKRGIIIRVLDSVNILGVTFNPYSPKGYFLDSEDFIREFKLYVPDIPVMDVMG